MPKDNSKKSAAIIVGIGLILFIIILCNMGNIVGKGNEAIGTLIFIAIIFIVGRLIFRNE